MSSQLEIRHLGHTAPILAAEPFFCMVTMDLRHYKSNEVEVKTLHDTIVIEGAQKSDENNDKTRTFCLRPKFLRKYKLPRYYDPSRTTATFSSDGILIVTVAAPAPPEITENIIKIEDVGPFFESSKAKAIVLTAFTFNYCSCSREHITTPQLPNEETFKINIAKPGSAPYQVSLQTLSGSHFCGGIISDERRIITVAGCLDSRKPSDFKILAGSQNLNDRNGTYFEPEEVNIHNNEKISIEIWRQINIIGLEVGLCSRKRIADEELQSLEVEYKSYGDCQYLQQNSTLIDYGGTCTFKNLRKEACLGDSGGPLTYNGKLVGLVNWGRPCALGYPDAHARISYFHDFKTPPPFQILHIYNIL
uniref:Peptidase S1 domain-containing protein n=1 Tax=Megaselia scalaris TaxID=36166 RepID=T1GSD9_MEGSC